MNKSILFLATLLLFIHINGLSQKKIYLDEKYRPVNKKESPTYYRTIGKKKDKLYKVKEYSTQGNRLLLEAECSVVEPKLIYNGWVIRYNENNRIANEGSYVDGKKHGLFKGYYDNGKPHYEMSCKNDKCKYSQYWFQGGKSVIANGNGKGMDYDSAKKSTNYIEFQDSLLLSAYDIRHDKKDTVYYNSVGLENGTFSRGVASLYRDIIYPTKARRFGVSGEVRASFIINKQGNLEEIEIEKGLEQGCSEAVLNCLNKNATGWIPSTLNGVPVKARFILPFQFTLTED